MPAQDSPALDVQAYGRIATRFHDALTTTRKALAAHAKLLPDGRLSRFDTLIGDFERRRVRIGIYGEVKAGKSSLLNAIAGAPLSPASFGPLTSVPIRVTWGQQTTWTAGGFTFNSSEELAAAMRGSIDVDEVTVTTYLDLLQLGGQVDIVDMPGVGSEDRYDEITAKALSHLDAVILVVRYPALFTRFSRHLLRALEGDVSKLFVVWNFDASCAELSPEARAEQVEVLRRNLAGAHELFTVDARTAFEAARNVDLAALERSGMTEFVEGLAAFAISTKRGTVALREAAKRVDKWMRQADEALHKRKTTLASSIAQTHADIDAIGVRATADAETARAGFEAFRTAVQNAGARRAEQAEAAAKVLRKELASARRSWMWTGDEDELSEKAAAASRAYADEIDAALRAATDTMHEAAHTFGTVITAAPRERQEPHVDEVGPEERLQRANNGRLQRTRRCLRAGWYLPGLSQWMGASIDADLQSQAEWFESTARAAEGAAQATLDAKLAAIEREATESTSELRLRRNLEAEEAELATLERDAPIVARQRATITALSAEAR